MHSADSADFFAQIIVTRTKGTSAFIPPYRVNDQPTVVAPDYTIL